MLTGFLLCGHTNQIEEARVVDLTEAKSENIRTWELYCDTLKRAGLQLQRQEAPQDDFNQAEGMRYLSRLARIGLEMFVEGGDEQFPTFMVPSHETAKIGADNPDMGYLAARINGQYTYRVSGLRGSAASINFSTKRGGYDKAGKLEPGGFIDSNSLTFAQDGSFELVISQYPQPGNWLKIDPDSIQLLIRQVFLDRANEKPAQLKIERIDADGKPFPINPGKLRNNLVQAARFVENTATTFANWAQSYEGHINQLPPADQALCQSVGGDPNIFYYHSRWQLAEDEALVIHLDRIPDCEYWNIQVNNYWMESLDYRYYRISLNQHSAKPNPDGSVTLVIAHRDPGTSNWLETAGHDDGTLCFRWIGSKEQVHPRTHVVKLNELPLGL